MADQNPLEFNDLKAHLERTLEKRFRNINSLATASK
jgi:hypothetical protein